MKCNSCGAPVTGVVCEYCGNTTINKYWEMMQEKKRLEKLRHDAENTVIPVHLSQHNLSKDDLKEIMERVKRGREIRI